MPTKRSNPQAPPNGQRTFSPTSQKAWRQWLKINHKKEQSVWLILYKKESLRPTISWSEAVDEALCFGWVDSVRRPFDDEKFLQFFSQRKPRGTWSKINKQKIVQLIAEKRMTREGLLCIERAKQNGSWTILDEVEELKVPSDLAKALKTNADAKKFFHGLSKSVKKSILQWLVLAKRPETRQKRIEEIIGSAALQLRPKHLRVNR